MNSIILKIVNNWDPVNLLCSGCPNDEYFFEVKQISELVSKGITEENLAAEINNIFLKAFGKDDFLVNESQCYDIAVEIIKNCQE